MSQLTKYTIALTNLYGMVHKDMVVEIFNNQNKEQISVSDVEGLLSGPTKNLEDASIYPYNNYFVHEEILDNDEFDLMVAKKMGKPYYVPEKHELLKYANDLYFEKSKQFIALLEYVKKHFFEGDEEKAEWLCEDIHDTCQTDVDVQAILQTFNARNISFKDMAQVDEAMQLVMDLANNVRIWENNGHTPQEIFERFEKPKLRPIPNKPFEFSGPNVIDMKTRKKNGRNDPCPSGSGKKYKNCCLVKED